MNEFVARRGLISLGNAQISGTTSITGNTTITGNLTISPSGSTISGNGGGLYNIPASGVTGLNLDRITSGSNSTIMTVSGLTVNTGITATSFKTTTGTSDQFLMADGTTSTTGDTLSIYDARYVNATGDSMGSLNINGTLNVFGNIIQSGTTYDTHLNHIYTTGDAITLRDGAISGQTLGTGYTGIIAKYYDGSNDGVLVFDSNGVARVGDMNTTLWTGTTQPIATREETPISSGFTYWDSGTTKFNTKLLTGSDMTYTNLTPTQTVNGGIASGSTFDNKSITWMFDSLLYPELFPTLVAPTSTFSSSLGTNYEVGVLISSTTFSSTFNRGSITPAYGTNGFLSGLPTQYTYGGSGMSNTVTTGLTDSKTITGYTVVSGNQSWTGSVSYSAGQQPLSNKGNNYNGALASGTTSTVTKTITGLYPFLFGMSASVLDGITLYPTFSSTRLIETQANKTVTLNGNLQYIYFAYPSGHTDLISIIDNNGFTVTGSFTKTTISVTSTGLGTNFTTGYKLYRTSDPTTVLSGSYIFKFN